MPGAPDFRRLAADRDETRRRLSFFRRNRHEILRQRSGFRYGENGARKKIPVNMLAKFDQTYMYELAPIMPKCHVGSKKQAVRAESASIELYINLLLEDINFTPTLQQAVQDAFVGPMGIIKVGIQLGDTEQGGVLHDVGQVWADNVDFDDFVFDTKAKRWENITYAGNRVRMNLEDAIASGLFDNKRLRRLRRYEDYPSAENEGGDDRVENISIDNRTPIMDFMDSVEMWEMYLPKHRMQVWMPYAHSDSDDATPLRVERYEGPEAGPYHILQFDTMPNQILAPSPMDHMLDLHIMLNALYRKLLRQAMRQKTFLPVPAAMTDPDVKRVTQVADGHAVRVRRLDLIREVSLGGPNPTNLAFWVQAERQFNADAGNLDARAGIRPQADTARQESLLSENQGNRTRFWQSKVYAFTRGIYKSIAQWGLKLPDARRDLVKKIKVLGEETEISFSFSPEEMESDFLDHDFTIEPYSMQVLSPREKLRELLGFVQQVYAPFQQVIAQQGLQLDFEALIKKYGDLSGLDDLNDILIGTKRPEQDQTEGKPQPPGKPSVTTRENIRTNISQGTRDGQADVLAQMLVSQGQGAGRPPG